MKQPDFVLLGGTRPVFGSQAQVLAAVDRELARGSRGLRIFALTPVAYRVGARVEGEASIDLKEAIRSARETILRKTLAEAGGDITETAMRLGCTYSATSRLVKDYGLEGLARLRKDKRRRR